MSDFLHLVPDDLSEAQVRAILAAKGVSKAARDKLGPQVFEDLATLVLGWVEHEPSVHRRIKINGIGEALYAKYPKIVEDVNLPYTPGDILNPRAHCGYASEAVDNLVDRACTYMLTQQEHSDRALLALKSQVGRSFTIDGLESLPLDFSLMRAADGRLRKISDVRPLVSTDINIKLVLLSVAKTSDFDAFEALKNSTRIRRFMTAEALVGHAKSVNQTLPAAFLNFLMTGSRDQDVSSRGNVSLGEWLSACIGAVPGGANVIYSDFKSAEFTKIAGHEIIHALFNRETRAMEGDDELIAKMVADGVDWYVGLQQYLFGSHVYFGLRDRPSEAVGELAELVEVGGRKKTAPVAELLLQALPESLVLQYADTPAKAYKVYKIAQLPYLREHISAPHLAKSLEVDLGL